MILSPEDKAAIYIVMSTLLPEDGIKSLSLEDTYLLRDRVAAVQGEVEWYRIQVDHHLDDLNSRIHSKSSPQPLTSLESRLAKLLKGKDIDTLLSEIDKIK